ncbi:MAG: hypothetical protein A2887_01190 [Alphaproteobacteria bacterium RIFCSPLOWO2_01_FULL_40_26]|nr:MAG: hypothetical protein A3D15_05440 [Alphaproteobacteria bacterium RIFCSPHIGHO2_02_FULL_40_34]OFW88580.1 MAG: hypothetical protein A2794_00280 [Alphaproteobacteria bacterium RIFCSPHIGHO2_01_FULL_40_8]OFW94013.1 MAG: hypothetical protein A2887_01190 [Alphaproteobacteria bacterium RIFCSPLOWO2_01_FULL_40_26]OFX09548.1 MAG: hypothetical protein A3H30_05675 [Alphaproteobacteria bacterium RIFCSPLOWO2_02_FULL_40_19]OFX10996.1 MAG: hypothetical protein A3G22_00235 [Alphaproteobacteria bacterium RI
MSLTHEIYRKFLHFLLILIPVAFVVFGKWKTLLILAPLTTAIVSLDYMRRNNDKVKNIFNQIFGIILREHEIDGGKLCGASWVFLGACVNFFFFKTEIAVSGFLILVISDALSALLGKSYPSQPFFEKSLLGSLAFFVSAVVILISCGIYFDSRFWFYFFGIFCVFFVTIVEARPSFIGIDDNFTIPIIFGSLMTAFDFMWS